VNNFNLPSLSELRDILEKIEGHETGWPLWLSLTHTDLAPYLYEKTIECWLAGTRYKDAALSDF
jgi:hypothetical protein